MDNKVKSCLLDIQISIDEIYLFLDNCNDFQEYRKDLKTKKAVERNLVIIGEAVNRIFKLDSNIQIENARNIVNTRNRIIHSYDNISDEVIWTIVSRELKSLRSQVVNLLMQAE